MDLLHLSAISIVSYFAGFHKKENFCVECQHDHYMDIENEMTYCRKCDTCDSGGK